MAVDDSTDTAYVPNTGNNDVSMIDMQTCNATVQSGCPKVPTVDVVGSQPISVAMDDTTDTAYVTNEGE